MKSPTLEIIIFKARRLTFYQKHLKSSFSSESSEKKRHQLDEEALEAYKLEGIFFSSFNIF